MTARSYTTKENGVPNFIDASHINDLQTAITALSKIVSKGGIVQGADASGTEEQLAIGTVGALLYAASTGKIAWSDVSKLIWDAANNRLGIGQATPTAGLHLPAGVAAASGAPLKLASGTNLTAAEAGAVEFDGTAFYATAAASSRQVVGAEQFVCNVSDVTLNSDANAQTLFASGSDVLTVQAATTYFFEAFYYLTTGTTTHTTATAFGGTATLTNILYWAEIVSSAATTIATASSWLEVVSAAATVLNATSTAASTKIRLRGVIRVNAGGTLIPQIKFSANPTGTNLGKTNSWFRLWPVGSNTVAAIGNWA